MVAGKDLSKLSACEYGELLRRVRERIDQTQQEMADQLEAPFTTYRKWEQGKRKPRSYYRRKVRTTFEETLYELGFLKREQAPTSQMSKEDSTSPPTTAGQDISPSTGLLVTESLPCSAPSDRSLTPARTSIASNLQFQKAPTLHHFIISNLTRRFWQIAHTDYSTDSEVVAAIQAAIQEFNRMNRDNPTSQITRRDAICELASIPIIALGQKHALPTRRYEEMLRYCTAALEACWELYRGSDPVGTRHAFKCVCAYVPLLETIAHDSAQHRKEALDLATQYALLQTLLGWGSVGAIATVPFAQKAHALSRETGNILLRLSASSKLGWAYSAGQKPTKALEMMEEGEGILREYQRKKNGLLVPSHVIGSFNSTYALVQAKNGICSDTTLGIATNSDTRDKHTAFTIFTKSAQYLEAAHTCVAKGTPKQAMIWIGKRIDLETFTPRPDVPQSERGRIETINVMTRALLQGEERDMGRIASAWQIGMEGAQALRDETRYQEAITNFEIMRAFWPNETAIVRLLPLTEHWLK